MLLAVAIPLVVVSAAAGYYYITFARMVDARLDGDRERTVPRIFARPFEVRPGDGISIRQMIDRLNDLGYANRARVSAPGEFAIGRDALALIPQAGSHQGQTVRLVFTGSTEAGRVREIVTVPPTGAVPRLALESPLITAIAAARDPSARPVSPRPKRSGPPA